MRTLSLSILFAAAIAATCEHKGRTYCRAHGQQKFLAPGKSVTFHVETGIL